jgi:tetratricopeptide (TPR) repeat protein
MRQVIAAVVLLWAALPASASTPEELDQLYSQRSEPSAVEKLEAALDQGLQATPEDYELLWRLARLRYWQADGAPAGKRRETLARQGWDVAEKAVKVAPGRVEGHYYAAVNIGAYSQAVGILSALAQGLEGRFNARIDKAMALDTSFERGGPWLAKGRYHYELPWPKRDLRKSAELYRKVLDAYPDRLRAWYYLAETLQADGQPTKALEALRELDKGGLASDPPEGRRVLGWSSPLRDKLAREVK